MNRTARPFHVGLVQMRCSTDPDDNLRRACAMLREAAARGAQVACLPELFRTQYFCQVEDPALFDLAEPIPGPSSDRLAAAAKTNGVVVVGSLFERRMPGTGWLQRSPLPRGGAAQQRSAERRQNTWVSG